MTVNHTLVAIAACFLTPCVAFLPNDYAVSFCLSIAMWIALTQSWVVLSGLTGYLSLGHVAFFGIGSYIGVLLWNVAPLWAILLLSGVAGGIFALLIGFPALRVRGPYFAMLTFGMAELLKYSIIYIEAKLGEFGRIIVNGPSLRTLYLLMVLLAIIATVSTYMISRSRYGYALRAIRENEEAAATAGIPVTYYKLGAFVFSAIIPAIAGTLIVMRSTYFEPATAFDPSISFMIVTMAIIGGSDDAKGPIVGSLFFSILAELLLTSSPQLYMIFLGVLLLLFVLFVPNGLVSIMNRPKPRPAS